MKYLASIALCFSLVGCVSKYAVDAVSVPTAKLKPEGGFYVMLPADGRYGTQVYPGSGHATAQAVVTALRAHTNKVQQNNTIEGLDAAKSAAAAQGLNYIVESRILNWEDRATEWSGIPDKITIQFAVHEVSTNSVVASTTMRASSKWATFGGDHPQDLLPTPTQRFIDQLF